jgi:hypothetical protein
LNVGLREGILLVAAGISSVFHAVAEDRAFSSVEALGTDRPADPLAHARGHEEQNGERHLN